MVLRLNIDQIELATRDWICKVQIVEIECPRESADKKCTFQILILEDEEECQIRQLCMPMKLSSMQISLNASIPTSSLLQKSKSRQFHTASQYINFY
ncbi:hypothetical protein H5410_023037 [Solanum commersonii]|uniref:Uncharacterized protein n=1 Tax=Solanum commersonii TaxID=4109 RepID=A0A9J5ZJ22_SOLCO|nr:hypothetical protein H5410_023037 [Solanum commersonii]